MKKLITIAACALLSTAALAAHDHLDRRFEQQPRVVVQLPVRVVDNRYHRRIHRNHGHHRGWVVGHHYGWKKAQRHRHGR